MIRCIVVVRRCADGARDPAPSPAPSPASGASSRCVARVSDATLELFEAPAAGPMPTLPEGSIKVLEFDAPAPFDADAPRHDGHKALARLIERFIAQEGRGSMEPT